jgi:hypothetical protein
MISAASALLRRRQVDVQQFIQSSWSTHGWVELVWSVDRRQDEDAAAWTELILQTQDPTLPKPYTSVARATTALGRLPSGGPAPPIQEQ